MSAETAQTERQRECEATVPEIVENLIRRAEQAMASDIHLQSVNGGAAVSFRLDGLMTPVLELSGDIAERVFGRIKFLARLNCPAPV